ncbi:hypothetical protein [Tunturiibacter gelidiferens]|uniref:Beta-lactamase-related domain-containing protein n=1 Tax=Tunturiibacter gelidiferens TaxID=3069689 RepID=A0AAU7YVF6_9BACT
MKLFRALTYGIVSLTSLSVAAQTPPAKHITDSVVPGAEWVTAAPESVGYSSARLEALRGWVKTQDTGSMMVIVQGRVIFSYGDVSHTSKIASVRKSVLNMLYGADVFKDQIKDDALNKTVRQLGLDDKVPFLPMEENATLIELMGSRSGIYIPTGNDGQAKTMPPRGSELPGAHFICNNWDFDAAERPSRSLLAGTSSRLCKMT